MMKRLSVSSLGLLLGCAVACAQEIPEIERKIPPAGIELEAEVEKRLESDVGELEARLEGREEEDGYADVAVLAKALRFALTNGEFFKTRDVAVAETVLAAGRERLAALEAGNRPWMETRGAAVAGYSSSIDGSLQPYGLEIPEGLDLTRPVRLYVWLHGRGDTKTDLYFVHERMTKRGKFAFEDGIVLHPFGRQCLGWKSAGEIDVLEAIADVEERFGIDPDRVALMGFSMGGAGAWHLGAHYPSRWAVVHAGAGFAETARYQNIAPEDYPVWYEQKLWGLYDVPEYVRSLFNLPVMVYSGEEDKQIQAARVMEEAYGEHGRNLPHVIGPGMGHEYHPESQAEVAAFVRAAMDRGRDRWPKKVSLQTRTLRYPAVHWVRVGEVAEHWSEARVDAELVSDERMVVTTRNVRRLTLHSPWKDGRMYSPGFSLVVDGEEIVNEKETEFIALARSNGGWAVNNRVVMSVGGVPPKKTQLQGPIDDAFMAPFLVVTPSGKSKHPAVQRWVEFELAHFEKRWREVFRGELRMRRDVEVTAEDRRACNLILWGDPESNSVMREFFEGKDEEFPSWNGKEVRIAGEAYPASNHVLAMIYPWGEANEHYVVINSGPTFREAHDRTNSLQNPKLPDWAVINLDRLPDAEAPGEVVAADFFDEGWRLRAASPR